MKYIFFKVFCARIQIPGSRCDTGDHHYFTYVCNFLIFIFFYTGKALSVHGVLIFGPFLVTRERIQLVFLCLSQHFLKFIFRTYPCKVIINLEVKWNNYI